MARTRSLAPLAASLFLACGPIPPEPLGGASAGSTSATDSGSSAVDPGTTAAHETSQGLTDTGVTGATDATTGEQTTGPGDGSSTGVDGSSSSSSGDPSGGPPEVATCEALPFCAASEERCPPAAQTNASVAGGTPLGPFASTFAVWSLPDIYGPWVTLIFLPTYTPEDLCADEPRLRVRLPADCWESGPELEVPAELDSAGQVVASTALLHGFQCNWMGFQCEYCEGHVAFTIEVVEPGWSLAGDVDAGCCRAYHDNNSL